MAALARSCVLAVSTHLRNAATITVRPTRYEHAPDDPGHEDPSAKVFKKRSPRSLTTAPLVGSGKFDQRRNASIIHVTGTQDGIGQYEIEPSIANHAFIDVNPHDLPEDRVTVGVVTTASPT